MRILLAMVAFVLAAVLIGFGSNTLYLMYRDNFFSLPLSRLLRAWHYFALIFGSILIGFAFVAAGVAMLIIKPRRE